ncbi:amino acid ABC transporter permease [Bifidobacterium pseudolongum subsp. globosum]|uniref:amino acid ABC transporter permease n=1 Tax=Bifidobacterium TaxID=1678 RepID=UPI001021202F|nr:amino acid ABC transporter permease [Bifidobacterium pseudolongum]RYQ18695.1 amino acid ABC transporter permease [Bifidobacterium pseudolongum subsp. globosum]
MDFAYVAQLVVRFLTKLPATLALVAVCFALGLTLAFLVMLGRLSSHRALRRVLEVYVSFVRSIPILLLLFIVYYGVPQLLRTTLHIDIYDWSKLVFAAITLVLFNAGWLSETLRAAYNSIDRSQLDLAQSLGYTPWHAWRTVIIPQMLGIALPDLGNAAVDLLKDTSLLFTIGVVDMMGLAKVIIANNYGVRQAEVYLAVGLVYWLAMLAIESIIHLSQRYNRFSRVQSALAVRGGVA